MVGVRSHPSGILHGYGRGGVLLFRDGSVSGPRAGEAAKARQGPVLSVPVRHQPARQKRRRPDRAVDTGLSGVLAGDRGGHVPSRRPERLHLWGVAAREPPGVSGGVRGGATPWPAGAHPSQHRFGVAQGPHLPRGDGRRAAKVSGRDVHLGACGHLPPGRCSDPAGHRGKAAWRIQEPDVRHLVGRVRRLHREKRGVAGEVGGALRKVPGSVPDRVGRGGALGPLQGDHGAI